MGRTLPGLVATGMAAVMLLAGCGNQYRPVVSAINPVGPAGQPTKYAVVVSNPGPGLLGLVTFVDFSGDTVLSTPSILTNPSYFQITSDGTEGFVVNPLGSLNAFGLGNPTSLQTKDVVQATLPAGLNPVSISAILPNGLSTTLFIPETQTATQPASIAILNTTGPSLLQQLVVADNPVYVVGSNQAPRVYAISQGSVAGANGSVASLEAATPLSISATIPVGVKPVYGVMTGDTRRAFILNQGSGTVSVINVVNNGLDSTTPVIPAAGTIGTNPVWADLSPKTSQLVVLSAGDGTHAGSLAIVNIPLCTTTTQTNNPNCNAANPVDAVGFGQVQASVPVGINPTMVSVLQDGTAAYVVNQKDSTGQCASGEGSVSVVSLVSDTVTATICGVSSANATQTATTSPNNIYGHPNTIAAVTGAPTGKVYVTSPDNQFLTVIYTDTNTVQTHINLRGLGLRVLSTSP
ncbi:MAG: YncE family protein [Acidobacteriota bacterium]